MDSADASAPRRRSSFPPPSKLVGATIGGKYRIRRLLGRGGMGSVYKAENLAIGRTVAVKLLHSSLADDAVTLARFQREAKAAASIAHPNVVEVLDMGVEANRTPYIVMEYVRGRSVAHILRAEGPLPVARACFIAGQVLEALRAAHEEGIVHRDLKPENVLVTARPDRPDEVKVLDFGLSTFIEADWKAAASSELTPAGRAMGTPHYASPELIRGSGGRDPRVDLYGVGVLLYEMLAGHRPFFADNVADVVKQILEDEPAPFRVFRMDVPDALEAVVRKAMAKDPNQRFAEALTMAEELVPFGASEPEWEAEPTDTFTGNLRELVQRGRASRPPRPGFEGAPSDDTPDRVRGELAAGLFEFVRYRVDDDTVEELLSAASAEARAAFVVGFEDETWYDDTILWLLERVDERVANGDLTAIAEAGRFLARRTAGPGGSIPGFAKDVTPEWALSTLAGTYARWFAACVPRVTRVGRGYGTLEVRPERRPSLVRAVLWVGYVDELLRLAGARDVDVRLAAVAAFGDGVDLFEAMWSS